MQSRQRHTDRWDPCEMDSPIGFCDVRIQNGIDEAGQMLRVAHLSKEMVTKKACLHGSVALAHCGLASLLATVF